MKSLEMNSRHSEKGMSLAEALIAVAVFTVVFLAALALYQAANRAYMATDAATIQQQNARFAIDRITETLRDAGANYSPRGAANLADEQVEGAWESAIVVRGDFDNEREGLLQTPSTGIHPIVTTGNDEIVGYVLRKPGAAANNLPITIQADVTPTVRDAIKTSPTATTNEETRTIDTAARTLAEQTNPPYQLARVTFDAAGNPVYSTIAENIFRLSFSYLDEAGLPVITATTATGSADAQRPVRASVRSLGVNLISMADRPDFGYTDPNTYTPAEGSETKNRRKFALAEQILATNLGMKGRRHTFVPAVVLNAPVSMTACTGHYLYYKLSWPASTTPGVSTYQLSIETTVAPVVALTVPVTGTEYRYQQPDPAVRNFQFKVAAIASGNVGAYSPTVTVSTQHDTVNSIPAVPVNVTGTQATGINAMRVNWDPVRTNTGFLAGTPCTTAGAGATSSAATPPWDNEAVDLASHKVYRLRYNLLNTGTFSPTSANPPFPGTRVDDEEIADLENSQATSSGGVLTGLWNFTDNTAAPCSQYFYRVKAFDGANLVAPGDGSVPMAAPAHFMPGPMDRPAKPQKPYVVGAIGTAGGNFNVNLEWLPVVRTAAGAKAATAHYQLLREQRIGVTGTWTAYPLLNPDFYETTSTVEVVPSLVGGITTSYRYAVKAIYDCGLVGSSDRSDVSDWYELVCAPPSGNSITITNPPNGVDISRPYETGFAPTLTMVGSVWTGATIDILDPAGQSVPGYPFTINTPPVLNAYNFPIWDSSGLPDGTYTLVAVGLAGACQSPPVRSVFDLETGQCGLSIVNPAWGGAGSNKYKEFNFTIRNNCDFASLTVSGLKFNWFNGGTNYVRTIESPSGVTLQSGLDAVTGANGRTIPFAGCPLTCRNVVIAPNGTSTQFKITFNDNMTRNNTSNPTTNNPFAQFNSIEASISSPITIQEEIVDAPPAP